MASLINAIIGANKQMEDQTIANQLLAGSTAAANAYLAAVLAAATPEIQTMYSSSLNQIVTGHGTIKKLCINKNWYKPYEVPKQQLTESFMESQTVITPNA